MFIRESGAKRNNSVAAGRTRQSPVRRHMSRNGAQGTDAPYPPLLNDRRKTEIPTNRWLIAVAGIVMQIALGAVYAWSVFRIPLTRAYGWSISQVTLTFELAILMLGLAAFAGGLWMKRAAPRRMAVIGGLGYGLGVILAGQARGNLGLLYLTFGALGGFGLGLCYIIPVATLIKWFPDKRGMITGLAVAGFGAGALVTAPVAERLIPSVGLPATFGMPPAKAEKPSTSIANSKVRVTCEMLHP